MSKTVILKNGTIVTDKTEYVADVKIDNGIITEIGTIEDIVGAEVINTSGSLLFPGFIDVHTHLDMGSGATKTADDFDSGSRAALAGGTTTLIDFATQSKGGTLKEALNEWKAKAENKAHCDYSFHMAMIDWNENTKQEMADMVKEGVTSFKMYMAYKGNLQVEDNIIYEALQESNEVGGLIGFHCENGDLIVARVAEALAAGHTTPYYHMDSRPDTVESEAIYRLTQIAKLADAPVWVVHLSTKEGLEIIRQMRKEGIEIVAETCPQYLVLDKSRYGAPDDTSFEGAKYVISPPLRGTESVAALWDGLAKGDIGFVTTDHCSFNFKGQKDLGRDDFSKIPNGGPGLEHRLSLLYTYGVMEDKLSLTKMVEVGATKPAEVFGLSKKGSIEVGKDADIVIFNPKAEGTITAANQVQNVDYTPYEGMAVKGQVEQVLLRGETVYKDGTFGSEAKGQFVPREKYNR